MQTIHRAAQVALALAVCAVPVHAGQDGPAPTLTITHRAQAVHPGDIVLLTVSAPAPLPAMSGDAFGRAVAFWAGETPGVWHGFVAVALDTPAGTYEVIARSETPDGTSTGVLPLLVESREFETRQLKVQSRFVNPPASESRRIERDARRLAAVFTLVSDRFWRGPFVPPVPGRSTSSFGRLSVMNGEPRGRHQGADFSARTGTPVLAPNAGRIALAEDLYYSGNTVVIDHGAGLFSLLAHMSRIDVKEGDVVRAGDELGVSGATGRVTGPHVHWAVRLGAVSVDPQSLMRAAADVTDPPATVVTR